MRCHGFGVERSPKGLCGPLGRVSAPCGWLGEPLPAPLGRSTGLRWRAAFLLTLPRGPVPPFSRCDRPIAESQGGSFECLFLPVVIGPSWRKVASVELRELSATRKVRIRRPNCARRSGRGEVSRPNVAVRMSKREVRRAGDSVKKSASLRLANFSCQCRRRRASRKALLFLDAAVPNLGFLYDTRIRRL